MKKTTLEILKRIEQKGFKAYVVGGYVRDTLLNMTTTDVDICTNATPKELKTIFKDANVSSLEYGSISLNIKNIDYEITTFRKEITYQNNRKPVEIKYIDDLYLDLLRRDFTINTLCMDKKGHIIDLLDAKKDLEKKVISTVGDPYLKLSEDSLRILRAIRFATVLNFKLDNKLKEAIIQNKYLLKSLSFERKKEELSKIFVSPNKEIGITLLEELEMCDVLDLKDIKLAIKLDDLTGIWSLITDNPKYWFTKFDKVQAKKIRELVLENLRDDYILYKFELYLSTIVAPLQEIDRKDLTKRYEALPIKNRNEIKIDINDICQKLHKQPGIFLKNLIDDVEQKIINRQLSNDKVIIENYILKEYNN